MTAMGDYLDELNDQQRIAVEYGDGPLLVLAGAGSGKTRVITYRIAHLIRERLVPPYKITAVTFTNKAAGEMRERVHKLLGSTSGRVSLGTFHGFCAAFLRMNIDRLGYDRNFTIFDADDQAAMVKRLLLENRFDVSKTKPRAVLSMISEFKQNLEGEPQAAQDLRTDALALRQIALQIYPLYTKLLKKNNAVDFDDLLLLTVRALERHDDLRQAYNDRIHYLLVDEYQDTNRVQYRLLRLLTEQRHNICAVGDDDQAIYRWRGADVKIILSFELDYPGSQVVKLERNYRSTGNILEAAHQVVLHAAGRKEKRLWTKLGDGAKPVVHKAPTERREAEFVALRIRELMNRHRLKASDCAVFYRTNSQSRVIEEELRRASLPYTVVGGVRFYERKEIKDALAYLRLLANPNDDVSVGRIINVPPRGIGAATVDRVAHYAAEKDLGFYAAAVEESGYGTDRKPTGANARLRHFVELIEGLRRDKNLLPLDDLLKHILEKSGYLDMLDQENS